MSSDFWAGYISGAAGIVIGNPLDVLKVRLQAFGASVRASSDVPSSSATPSSSIASGQPLGDGSKRSANWLSVRKLSRGIAPPLLTYGPLNALLFVSYNRTLQLLDPTISDPSNLSPNTSLYSIWLAGAIGGLATWIVSAPTESIKCRAQAMGGSQNKGSFSIARELWAQGGGSFGGIRNLYLGGGITSVRDAVGYGFYFWSYELCKRSWQVDKDDARAQALRVLVCGGIAGVITWASIFPLDVIKTRYQIQDLGAKIPEASPLLTSAGANTAAHNRQSAFQIAREAYRQEGLAVFFRGLGVCSVRAFIVNAVQWTVYEWTLRALRST